MKISSIARRILVGEATVEKDFEALYILIVEGVNGWMSKQECSMLYQVANSVTHVPDSVFVEIGSYEGKSSICLARGMHPSTSLLCVDPHTGDRLQVEMGLAVNTYANFLKNVQVARCSESIVPIVNTSVQAAFEFEKKKQTVSLLFIDGWHSQMAVEQDITAWSRFFGDIQTVIFDDFLDAEVLAGIISKQNMLPPFLGSEGKLAFYSNDPSLKNSKIGKYLIRKRRYEYFRNFIRL